MALLEELLDRGQALLDALPAAPLTELERLVDQRQQTLNRLVEAGVFSGPTPAGAAPPAPAQALDAGERALFSRLAAQQQAIAQAGSARDQQERGRLAELGRQQRDLGRYHQDIVQPALYLDRKA